MANLESRQERGQAIASINGQVKRLDDFNYKVASQSGNGEYLVHTTYQDAWKCSCPDNVHRAAKCKHIWAVEFSSRIRETVRQNITLTPVTVTNCLTCGSPNLKKFGVRRNKCGDIQRFACLDCKRTFSVNLGFERMKHSPQAVTSAMQLYFSGESLRNTQRSLRLLWIQVSHQTIYKWIRKYVSLMQKYLERITPQVSDTWRADEMYVKINGDMKYLFALIDDETRFWIAQEVADSKFTHDARHLFQLGKEKAGKKPLTLITDGLASYHDAYLKEFYTRARIGRTVHQREIALDGIIHNNKMERFNGELRDRERVMRGLKTPNTPILDGMQVFHNYVRPHEALNGETPADKCGIHVQGENKWLTIIQNARRATDNLHLN